MGITDVSISLNAQDFVAYPVQFTVFPHAQLNAFVPSSGPRSGNTSILLEGSHFFQPATPTPQLAAAVESHGLDFRCKFGLRDAFHVVRATLVNDSALLCSSPPREYLLPETVQSAIQDIDVEFQEIAFHHNDLVTLVAPRIRTRLSLTASAAGQGRFHDTATARDARAYFAATFEALFGGDGYRLLTEVIAVGPTSPSAEKACTSSLVSGAS